MGGRTFDVGSGKGTPFGVVKCQTGATIDAGTERDGLTGGISMETPVGDAGRHAAAGCVTVTVENTVTFAPTPRFTPRSWGFGHAKTPVAIAEVVKMETFMVMSSCWMMGC